MDVKGIGQGGQTSFDFTVKNVESDTGNVAQVNSQELSVKKDNSELTENGKYDEKDVKKAVDKFNKLMEDTSTVAEFTVHEKFGDTMIKIVNKSTKEVVAEVPPKKILDMVAKFCEMAGMVFDKKA